MTPREIEEIEKMYEETSKGSSTPSLVMISVPGFGLYHLTKKHVYLNGYEATEEGIRGLRSYLKLKI